MLRTYLKNLWLGVIGLAGLIIIIQFISSPGHPTYESRLPQSMLQAAEPGTLPQAPPIKDPDKDGGKASPKRPGCPCECGCGESGVCTCGGKDGGGKGDKKKSLSYSEGYSLALSSGKPLVYWVGGFRCPACENELTDCIHCYGNEFRGESNPCVVVAKPSGGELYRCGTITGACSASKITGLLANGGNATRGASNCPGGYCDYPSQCGIGSCSAGGGCSSCGMAYGYAPSFGYGGPVFGGGCANGSCGSGGGYGFSGPSFFSGNGGGGGGCASCGGSGGGGRRHR